MPPLEAFGRKWEIGSDNLVFPTLGSLIFVRVPWFIGTIVLYYKNEENFSCDGGEYIRFFLYGAMAILHFMILNDILLIMNSMMGGVMDTHARRFVPLCIYFKIFLYFVEAGWNILGIYGCVNGYFDCEEAPGTYYAILSLIACNWILLLCYFCYILRQYDPYGTLKLESIIPSYDENTDSVPKTPRIPQWERRFRLMLCCVCKEGHKMDEVYSEAARNAGFIFNNSDLVFSDIIVGIVLWNLKTESDRKKYNERKYGPNGFKFQSSINYDSRIKSLKLPPMEDWNSIPKIIHFMNYGLAIFTIPAAYEFNRKICIKALCTKTQCCNCLPGRKKYPVHAENDNCCYAKTAAMTTFIKDEDIVYASYKNSEYCIPFYVALDHSTKTIVIALRGSFSFVDFLIDSSCTPVPMNIPGLPPQFKAHQGILKVSKAIKQRLDKLEVLQKLNSSYPDYTILTTGFSLGAGAATILSMMLKLEFSNVKCLAYAVPAATVSKDAAEYCDDFLTSIVYGDDMFPRFNFPSFKQFVNDIKHILNIYRVPKYRIQLGIFCRYFALRKLPDCDEENGLDSTISVNQYLVSNPSSSSSSDISVDAPNIKEDNGEVPACSVPSIFKQNTLGKSCSIAERLRQCPPGKILHIYETPIHRRRKNKKEILPEPRWEIRWADRTDFNEMIYSKRMFIDHMPFRMLSALNYFSKYTNTEEILSIKK